MLSIIIPIYNVEKYLTKCIESVINQTYKNLEIILVNDGSTDNSKDIINKYSLIDSRIKVINKKNGGLSDARNVGIEIAKGDYIAFLDSDDWVELNMYEKLYSYIKQENADIAQCSYQKVYNEEVNNQKIKEEIKLISGKDSLYNLSGKNAGKTVVVWNKIYKRELFNDIRFPKGKYHEDEFTTYKVLYKANKIVDLNLPLVYYRQRDGSITNSKFNIKRLDALEAFNERLAFYKEKNLDELQQLTLVPILRLTNEFYIKIKDSDIDDKYEILKLLRQGIKKDYILFMKNKYVSFKRKILLTIFVLNKDLFYKIYKNKVNKK
ncbi:MAG: glycosyltransferase [Romboutsia timonensis]|uniref:glycosyltransferase n=1 Tax=Romboutsia timonensis TaxID=1776391 RepID=UPI002A760BB4|nr:glycosyltransferase [Romboutsia timonensis]MDY3001340.1 glycosyltransferase [Romboutsia timonensis]